MADFLNEFDVANFNIPLDKGETKSFVVLIQDIDLRGSLIFSEVRKNEPGLDLIFEFLGSVTQGESVIKVAYKNPATPPEEFLDRLPVFEGDNVTLEGSGIDALKVISVQKQAITVAAPAVRSVLSGRLFRRARVETSFEILPVVSENFDISLGANATAGTVTLVVSGVIEEIPAGTVLVFQDGVLAKTAVVASDVSIGATSIVATTTQNISSAAVAKIGSTTVRMRSAAIASSTLVTLNIEPLSAPIPAGTVLNFGYRSVDGWRYIGSATTATTALTGATTLDVPTLAQDLPATATAWTGTIPFNTFQMSIAPSDLSDLLSEGGYKYDVIIRQPNASINKLMQGSITFEDAYTDVI